MSLEEKLRQIAERPEKETADWEVVKAEWIAAVDKLYHDIEDWFGEYLQKDYMKVVRTPIRLQEEYLGEYDIDMLEIVIGETIVSLEPVARLVIGARGRIDVFPRGYRDDALFLIHVERVDGKVVWELRQRKDRGYRKDFTKTVFEELLESWL